ncbi:hypothetical protein D0Z07_9379 [Hyphodiscus hymeniophilus]|uniref:Mtf2-like C-terminal domain-containing protein n=1 Tax=Hyphodiscus hymeniophilus TaxID=353542 RepID=A0A9P6VDF7_9HELO|nr:hypothetical protein D0Z07_9379 [Hyphodiscus hymeniophilus]
MASKVAVEVLPIIFSTVPLTMTPFLFQTRTLARLQKGIPIGRPHGVRRNFSGGISRQDRAKQDETTTATLRQEKTGPTIRRTTIMRTQPRFSGGHKRDHDGSPDLESVPQSSILRRVYDSEGDQRLDVPWDTAEVTETGFDGIETHNFYDMEDDFLDDEDQMDAWTRHTDPSQDRKTTITATERSAFEAIFKNIRNKTANAHKYGGLDGQGPSPAARLRARERLEGLMGKSMIERFPKTRDEMETVVNRYPPSLRALAAKAVGLDYDEAHFEETAKQEEVMDNDQLEVLRQPIREAVEARMRAAATDAELWDVLEEEVFPLIEKLGLEKAGEEKRVKRPGRTKRPIAPELKAQKVVLPPEHKQTVQFEPIVHMGQEVSPLAFYGPLYPSYLLLGLRLLDRSFSRPSPLTLSILPKIKSLGLISHVLGASTQLYNELLIVHWYQHDDFRGVYNLLTEMEEHGLPFNKETSDIVRDIIRMQARILRGDRGPTLKELWSLPEFAPGKFGPWHKKIEKMMAEDVDPVGQLSY